MRDELLTYYERELSFIRRQAAEFADKYPKIAGRLLLERGKCEDPHVERLIESFALLSARIHLKIDDEFPEITESLLQVLYPHYLAPVPSTSIAQLELDPEQGKISTGYSLDRHQVLYSKPTEDTICKFRTCYPVTLWPLEVASARVETPGPIDAAGRAAPAALVLRLRTQGDATFSELEIGRLRLYLAGESQMAHRIYEAIFGTCSRLELRAPNGGASSLRASLPPSSLAEVGFGRDEGLLAYSPRSFLGYRLLQEYFHFPEKFLFVDVLNLEPLRRSGLEREVDLVFALDRAPRLDQRIDADGFKLGCTPIINLFQQLAEPIRLDHAHVEYRVIPDVRRQLTTEIYAINAVTTISPTTGTSTTFEPFYSFKHSFERRTQRTFWHATRRPSERKDDQGTEVYLSLVDLNFRPTRPPTDVVTVNVTCTNRDLPGHLTFGDPAGDFDLEGAAPVKAVRCLTKPTRTLRLPLRHGTQWRLISHLSLNYLSPVEWGGGSDPEVLQELLRLYDFTDSPVVQQQISGIVEVQSRQTMRRIRSKYGSGFARGVEATVELDESKFVGSGVYLFSSILEKFLGLYVSINAYSELVAKSRQRGVIKAWPPRTGYQSLL
jgi:type VI secretion system protein ImpG